MERFAEKLIMKTIGFERYVLREGLGNPEGAFHIKIFIVLNILGHYHHLNY